MFSLDPGDGRIEGYNFRVDAELADLAGDELGVLRAEIEDEDFVHAQILSEPAIADKGRCAKSSCIFSFLDIVHELAYIVFVMVSPFSMLKEQIKGASSKRIFYP